MPLRDLRHDDLEMVLRWRNAPEVRRSMYRQHEISWDEHRRWFQGLRDDMSRRWYVYCDAREVPQGVVYFTGLGEPASTATWGFYCRPGAPAGTGTQMLLEGLELGFGTLGLAEVRGEALASNIASVRLHRKLGFTAEDEPVAPPGDTDAPVEAVRFVLRARDWPARKARLLREKPERGGGDSVSRASR